MPVKKSLVTLLLLSQAALAGWEAVPSGTTASLSDVIFFTPQRGYVLGDRVLLKTDDSGKTWSKDSLSFGSGRFSFTDPDHGVISGGPGDIRWTSDGGGTWHKAVTPDTGRITSLIVFPDGSGYAHGNVPAANTGFLWKTSDQGKTWTFFDTSWSRSDAPEGPRLTLSSSSSSKFSFPSRNIGYLSQRLGTLKTTDGGATWHVAKIMSQDDDYMGATFVQACHFVNDSVGVFTGTYYSGVGRTENGLRSVQKGQSVGGNDIFLSTEAIGYLAGGARDNGVPIRRTSDGGTTWTIQPVAGSDVSLNKVFFTNPNRGVAVGSRGLILRTTDGGGSPVGLSPAPRHAARPRVTGLIGRMVDVLGRSLRPIMRE
jgi:photosystem II stability/assembly factor-like uncharacterized protein